MDIIFCYLLPLAHYFVNLFQRPSIILGLLAGYNPKPIGAGLGCDTVSLSKHHILTRLTPNERPIMCNPKLLRIIAQPTQVQPAHVAQAQVTVQLIHRLSRKLRVGYTVRKSVTSLLRQFVSLLSFVYKYSRCILQQWCE